MCGSFAVCLYSLCDANSGKGRMSLTITLKRQTMDLWTEALKGRFETMRKTKIHRAFVVG